MYSIQRRLDVIIIFSLCALVVTEPVCSKFDYEEKMLEKMVRLEVKFEGFIDEFKNIRTIVKEGLEKMEHVREMILTDSLQYKENLTSNFNNMDALLKEELEKSEAERVLAKHDLVEIKQNLTQTMAEEMISFRGNIASTMSNKFAEKENEFETLKDKVEQAEKKVVGFECIFQTGQVLLPFMTVGARVVRGGDWKWDDQDGGPGGKGTIIGDVNTGTKAWVRVQWDNGSSYNYIMGANGNKYDLKPDCS